MNEDNADASDEAAMSTRTQNLKPCFTISELLPRGQHIEGGWVKVLKIATI
jgi:hypothetical protein